MARNKLTIAALVLALPLALAACENGAPDWVTKTFPNTTAGYEQGGILGALDGASSALLARCQMLDGEEVQAVIDTAAAGIGPAASEAVEQIRALRRRACAAIGAVNFFVDGAWIPVEPVAPAAAPEPAAKPAS